MQVFLSWSGERSNRLAVLLSEWLPQVIQAAEPFISTSIEKGRRWSGEIAERLSSAPVGIICVTRDNLSSPWLLFEAGAISKPRDGYVCTFLLDVEPADVEPPLGEFQHTAAAKADVLRLVQTINGALGLKGEKPLSEAVLERVFERNWPELEMSLENIRASRPPQKHRARSDRAILDEILALVRRSSVGPEMWREAAFIDRLADFPFGVEAGRTRANVAFVYTIRIPGVNRDQLANLIARIEHLDGLVTCRSHRTESGDEIECVFLRSAEPDLTEAMRGANIHGQVAVVRSTSFEPGQNDAQLDADGLSNMRLQPSARKNRKRRG